MAQLRAAHPDAAIRIERRGDARTPNPVKLYRYKITEQEKTFYSRIVPEAGKDQLHTEVREMFPRAEIVEESA